MLEQLQEKKPVQTSSIAIQTLREVLPNGDPWGNLSPVPVKVEASDRKQELTPRRHNDSVNSLGSRMPAAAPRTGSSIGGSEVMAKHLEIVTHRLEKLREENKKLRLGLLEEKRITGGLKAQISAVTSQTDSAFSQLILIEEELEKSKQLLQDKDDLERIRCETSSQCL